MAKKYSEEKMKKNKKKGRTGKIIMIIAVVAALLVALTGFLTDWMWFKDLDYTSVFWKKLLTELEIGIPTFIILSLLMRFYLRTLKNGYFKQIESHEIPDARKLNVTSWVLSFIFGFLMAVHTSRETWLSFLKAINSTSFDLKDPLFNLDVSFYIFKLGWLNQINSIVILAVIGMVIVTLIYYSILLAVRTPDFFEVEEEVIEDNYSPEAEAKEKAEPDVVYVKDGHKYVPFNESEVGKMFKRAKDFAHTIQMEAERDDGMTKEEAEAKLRAKKLAKKKKKGSKRLNNDNMHHLVSIASGKIIILGIVFYLMLGVDFGLQQFELLHTHTGTVYGAGFTDVNITLWVYRIIMALSVVGAITLAGHIKKGELSKLIRVPLIMALIFAVGIGAQKLVQGLIVSPDEINKESKYLENNIEFTRHAYGLDDVRVATYKADASLDASVISNNDQTISNIRINDYEPVKDFYNQTQSIRQYYTFNDVDIDRYTVDGVETQTYLAAREIDETKISDTWLNKHLKYTHGYGVAVSQVNAVTASGQPDVVEGNIPPETEVEELQIDRPEIYFGEQTNDYIIVNTKEQEFDYPDGEDNKYSSYEGESGVKLNLINRVLYAIREGSIKILVSSNITSDSRIIYERNVVSRIEKIMPYLQYEEDPYLTIVDGKLYWIMDAYTTSSRYPYSEPYSDVVNSTNYIRNSVKVVVDAYNGDVDFYVVDETDPIAQTYQKIFPDLFKSADQIPEGIKSHLRYPNALFKIQASVYSKYHMDDVKVFYQKEDLWDIANQIYGTESTQMDPSYYIFNLPDTEEGAEFINMIPFTPKSKQNMTAIMMARNDGDNYGELIVYTMPKNKTVYGPMQIEAQIDQNTEISKEFSLWASSGSTYKRGDLFVIPIGTSIMYVEPVYLEASNQAIPEVKRVIVAYQDKIAYESTLSEALVSLFGGEAASDDSGTTGGNDDSGTTEADTTASLIKKAQNAYEKAVEAQKEGDWEAYGKYLNQLENYLNKLG